MTSTVPATTTTAGNQTTGANNETGGGGTTTTQVTNSQASKKNTNNNTRKKSTTMSAGKKRKKKKAQKPPDFDNWAEEYKKSYDMVSQLMREWKATQKQCEPIITVVSRFKTFTKRNKDYTTELAAYEQAKSKIPVIAKDETFDWERS